MRESPSNIRDVCKIHAPKPDSKFQKMNPDEFKEKFVKKGFISKTGRIEHMWVIVEKVVDGKLVGRLNNDPTLDHAFQDRLLKCDDEVAVELAEIEDVLS